MDRIKSFFTKYYVQIFFVFVLLLGIFTFKDYGSYNDEFIQRNHSLVSYYKIKSTISHYISSVNTSDIERAIEREKLHLNVEKYPYKYYGVAIQLPLVFIEDIFNFKLSYRTIFLIRHLYTYIIFFLSLMCLYKIIEKYIIKNKKYALLAVLLMILSPRIYGEAFYNIKDLVFMSMGVINIYFIFRYLKNSSFINLLMMCFISALVINCRVVGGIYIALAFLYNILCKKHDIQKCIKDSMFIVVFTYLFYVLVTPASWSNPIVFPFKTIKFFYNYVDPISKLDIYCLHFGKYYAAKALPADYVPVWIFITTPLLYIILFTIGIFKVVSKNIISVKKKDFKSIKFSTFCNTILIVMLLFVIIKRPTLYGGWRHLYFLYPLIIIDAVIGIKCLLSIKQIKKIVVVLLILNSLFITQWMIRNHPYQYEYYEYLLSDKIVKNFAINYYQVSNIDAIEYILKHDNRKQIKVAILSNKNATIIKLARGYKRIKMVDDISDSDYFISNYAYDDSGIERIFKEIYCVKLDNKYRLFTIYGERID